MTAYQVGREKFVKKWNNSTAPHTGAHFPDMNFSILKINCKSTSNLTEKSLRVKLNLNDLRTFIKSFLLK
jgi:hypothetical protein